MCYQSKPFRFSQKLVFEEPNSPKGAIQMQKISDSNEKMSLGYVYFSDIAQTLSRHSRLLMHKMG